MEHQNPPLSARECHATTKSNEIGQKATARNQIMQVNLITMHRCDAQHSILLQSQLSTYSGCVTQQKPKSNIILVLWLSEFLCKCTDNDNDVENSIKWK